MSTRAAKEQEVRSLRERFDKAVAAVFVDFQGLDVETVTALRVQFRQAGVDYKVAKNSLVRLALVGTPLEGQLDTQLRGSTGVAWSYEDPSSAAKILMKFRKDQAEKAESLRVKCGILDNGVLEARRVEVDLASLPGKDEIRAQLLATLVAPAQNLVRQLLAPSQNFAYVLGARERGLGGGAAES